jgi:hypothetical protein
MKTHLVEKTRYTRDANEGLIEIQDLDTWTVEDGTKKVLRST